MDTIVGTADVAEMVIDALYAYAEEDGTKLTAAHFDEAGVLTNNDGLVLKVDGKEFQITIVRSK